MVSGSAAVLRYGSARRIARFPFDSSRSALEQGFRNHFRTWHTTCNPLSEPNRFPRRVSVDRRAWLVRPTGCQVIRATALGQHHPDIELPGKGAWSSHGSRRLFAFRPAGKPAGKAEEGHMNTSVRRETLVIIGNGMVGHHCVARLVEQGALERFEVRVFGEERQRAYDRVHLSEYFGGRDAESLAMCEADFYAKNGVDLHLGEAVIAIDRERKEVVTEQGRYAYDQLVLATGSYPFVPP